MVDWKCCPFLQGDKKLMEHLGKLGADVLSSTGSTGTVVVIQVRGGRCGMVGIDDAHVLVETALRFLPVQSWDSRASSC